MSAQFMALAACVLLWAFLWSLSSALVLFLFVFVLGVVCWTAWRPQAGFDDQGRERIGL